MLFCVSKKRGHNQSYFEAISHSSVWDYLKMSCGYYMIVHMFSSYVGARMYKGSSALWIVCYGMRVVGE